MSDANRTNLKVILVPEPKVERKELVCSIWIRTLSLCLGHKWPTILLQLLCAADFPSISCDDRAILRGRQGGRCDNCCSCGNRRQSNAELYIFLKSQASQGWGWGGEVTSCGYSASLVQASYNVCAMPARF